MRAEGKLLTAKQRADQRRAQEMLEHLKAQGVSIPETGEKKGPRLGSKAHTKKKQEKKSEEKAKSEEPEETQVVTETKVEKVTIADLKLSSNILV